MQTLAHAETPTLLNQMLERFPQEKRRELYIKYFIHGLAQGRQAFRDNAFAFLSYLTKDELASLSENQIKAVCLQALFTPGIDIFDIYALIPEDKKEFIKENVLMPNLVKSEKILGLIPTLLEKFGHLHVLNYLEKSNDFMLWNQAMKESLNSKKLSSEDQGRIRPIMAPSYCPEYYQFNYGEIVLQPSRLEKFEAWVNAMTDKYSPYELSKIIQKIRFSFRQEYMADAIMEKAYQKQTNAWWVKYFSASRGLGALVFAFFKWLKGYIIKETYEAKNVFKEKSTFEDLMTNKIALGTETPTLQGSEKVSQPSSEATVRTFRIQH